MKIDKLLEIVEKLLPSSSAMEGDKLGLQINPENRDILKLLVTLEITEEVINEAIENRFDCIITFHPLIYFPLLNINISNRIGHLSSLLIKNNISVISVHTNFDAYINGTSRLLANKLELEFVDFLVPNIKISNTGMGIIVKPNVKLNESELLEKVHSVCCSPLKYCNGINSQINRIAIVGGSGISFLNNVLNSNIQAFITADVSYHYFHQVKNKIMLIDPGHYEMEQFVPNGIAELLKNNVSKSEIESIKVSKVYTNPINYYPLSDLYESKQKQIIVSSN